MIPSKYIIENSISYHLAHSPIEQASYKEAAHTFIDSALSSFLVFFDIPYSFRLVFILFHTSEDFYAYHNKKINSNSLLVSYCSIDEAHIAFFSAFADPANNNKVNRPGLRGDLILWEDRSWAMEAGFPQR